MKTTNRFRYCRPSAIAGLFVATFFMTSVHAQERAQLLSETATDFNRGWGIGANTEYSDNILRAEDDRADETSVAAFLRFDFGARRARWSLTAASDLQYRTYLNDTLDNQLEGAFSGIGEFYLFDDVLSFRIEDRFGQTRIDYAQPDTPDNRESINELTAGVALNVPLGKRLSFFATDNWSSITYKESDRDSERNEVSAGLNQKLTERSAVFVSATRSRMKFKTPQTQVVTFDDYGIDEASIGLSASSPKTAVVISAGKTRIRGLDDFPEQSLVRASIVRRLGSRFEVRLEGGTEYTDATQTFVRQQDVFGVRGGGMPGLTVSPDPFKSDYASTSLAYDGSRYSADIGVSGRRERHELDRTLDAKFVSAQMGIGRRFSERADVYLRASYDRSEGQIAAAAAVDDEFLYDTTVRLGVNLRPWRNVVVESYVEHNTGRSLGLNYRENVAGVSIGYSPPQR